MSSFKFHNLSVIVNCVTKSQIHWIALNLNRCLCSGSSDCSDCGDCNDCSDCSDCSALKSKVTHWLTDWQHHLLSCPGQLKRRISHNQVGGRSPRYVEETASSVQSPTPGWSPSRAQCSTITPSIRGGGGVHQLILPPHTLSVFGQKKGAPWGGF